MTPGPRTRSSQLPAFLGLRAEAFSAQSRPSEAQAGDSTWARSHKEGCAGSFSDEKAPDDQ